MRSQFGYLKIEAIELRKKGKTYLEIRKELKKPIPKSTLSLWCKNFLLDPIYKDAIEFSMKKNIHKGRAVALAVKKVKRDKYLSDVKKRIVHLGELIANKDVAKIALAILYLGEGAKTKSSLMFGNSDPKVVELFLRLLRHCYIVDENKFRCTLQCRADQDIEKLEKFWSSTTKIPRNKFYKARIDKRTIGKLSKKQDYMGVCRIDYFSADIFNELMKINEVIYTKGI